MSVLTSTGFHSLPLPIGQLSLAAVLKCGQSFRWTRHTFSEVDSKSSPQSSTSDAEYRLCLKDRVVCVKQNEKELLYRAIFPQASTHENSSGQVQRDKEILTFIHDYFQLDRDLLKLYEVWGRSDPVFNKMKDRFSGIRILRQDPWETLVSFICSANNNISRITKMVQNLCTHFSDPLISLADKTGEQKYHSFPPPSVLAPSSVADKLRELGFGYRAKFIQKTAAMLMGEHGSDAEIFKWLSSLRSGTTDEAREELLKLMGVGRKVADCVLLMSLDKPEVVPVDTHVLQIVVKHYGFKGTPGSKVTISTKLYDDINAKLVSIWGPYSGWAHSVMFTADLKAFTNYNLPSASSANEETPLKRPSSMLPTPSPSPSPKKRKQTITAVSTSTVSPEDGLPPPLGFSDENDVRRKLRTRKTTRRVVVRTVDRLCDMVINP